MEQTTNNFHKEFISNWVSKLKSYAFDLMKDIMKFCDKTITETKPAIQNIGANLKASMEGRESEKLIKR